jgi:hypothetical protein
MNEKKIEIKYESLVVNDLMLIFFEVTVLDIWQRSGKTLSLPMEK